MPIKVKTDDKEFEVNEDQLELPEGYALVTPDRVPDGLLTKDKFNSVVKEQVNKTKEKTRQELEEDSEFHKSILDKYRVKLDDEGNPVGLKPTVDVDEVRQTVTKEVADRYESKLEELNNKLSTRDQSVVSDRILSAVSGKFKDDWVESIDGETPLAVMKFQSRFKVDENGREYAVDEEGNKMFKNDGSPVRAKDYFSDESKFGKFMKDNRQAGSNFNKPGNPNSSTSKKRSEISAEEKASMFAEWRKQGKKPIDEWNKIPY